MHSGLETADMSGIQNSISLINTVNYSGLFTVVLFNKLDWMLQGVLLDDRTTT
jgi:hypothetical protein